MTFKNIIKLYALFILLLFQNCKNSETDDFQNNEPIKNNLDTAIQELKPELNKITPSFETPIFNEDSAFLFIEKQIAFGPRVPNLIEHENCARWLDLKMKKFGFNVIVQKGKVTAFNGIQLNISNIIASHKSEAKGRILLCAHWDTRPFADRDSININSPIDGANDGASGVGVLLEVARNISMISPGYGIDIIFFDAEDYGVTEQVSADLRSTNETWCLGSQYWCKNPIIENYQPKFGILLDMVGAKDAKFYKEGVSAQYANKELKAIWQAAIDIGYGNYFINKLAPEIIDDHVYINSKANIPTIDIVHYVPKYKNGVSYGWGFGTFHHKHADNMNIIHKPTLKAVGQTLLHLIYQKI